MPEIGRYDGLVEIHDPVTALRERVWAVLVARDSSATPFWRSVLVPATGAAFGALRPAHLGRTVRVRLLAARDAPAAWMRLEQWQEPVSDQGIVVETARVAITVLGLSATVGRTRTGASAH